MKGWFPGNFQKIPKKCVKNSSNLRENTGHCRLKIVLHHETVFFLY